MLLTRYNNLEYILNLDIKDGIDLINKAVEKTIEKRDWDMWISVYPTMNKDTFVPFDKFRSRSHVKKRNKLSKEEIIAKAEELRKIHQGTHEGVLPLPESSLS